MTPLENSSRYAPRGIEKDKPFSVRFLPQERVAIMEEASKESRSGSAFVRLMTLKGMAAWKAEKSEMHASHAANPGAQAHAN